MWAAILAVCFCWIWIPLFLFGVLLAGIGWVIDLGLGGEEA